MMKTDHSHTNDRNVQRWRRPGGFCKVDLLGGTCRMVVRTCFVTLLLTSLIWKDVTGAVELGEPPVS